MEINFGDGVDKLTVKTTSHAMHIIDLNAEDDTVLIESIAGPFLVHGRKGNDTVIVQSEEQKLDQIQALLGFDGGNEDDGSDQLILNDEADIDTNDVWNVTRFLVETNSMSFGGISMAPSVSYLLNFRGATGGTFTLEVTDPVLNKTATQTISYPLSNDKYEFAVLLESVIQRMIIPEEDELDSCGLLGESKCSHAVKVFAVADDAFAVFFVGERLGEDMSMQLYTESLIGFEEEMFLNQTNDILLQNSDLCYSNLEVLDIRTGDLGVVLNVRGTSATSMTTITTQTGDDYLFLSSEANEDQSTCQTIDHLLGWLDYMEYDLTVNTDTGRHRLLLSDERSTIAKGRSDEEPMTLTKDSLTNIHENVGDFFFTTNGNWSAGVNLWLGEGGKSMFVIGIMILSQFKHFD